MAVRTTVELYNPNQSAGGSPHRVAVVEDFKYLSYTMRLNDRGDCTLDIDANATYGGGRLLLADLFLDNLDLMLVVYREDVENRMARYVDGEFFHRTSYQYQEVDGAERFTCYGRGLTDLLARRIVAYPSGDPGAEKEGEAETVLKEYIEENLGASAIDPPRYGHGVAPYFVVEPYLGLGDYWWGSRSWRNLLDVAQELAAFDPTAAGLGFDFLVVSKLASAHGTPGDWLEFQVARPWGLDRTVGQFVNPPAVFSTGNGNMLLPQVSESHIEEKTRVFALGQGEDEDRDVWQEDDAVRQARSLWGVAEMVRNANMEEEMDGLEVAAKTALAETAPRRTFAFQVLQTTGSRYGRDYGLGDLITARYKGVSVTRKIVGVTVRVSAEGGTGGQREEVRLDLGEVSPFGATAGGVGG